MILAQLIGTMHKYMPSPRFEPQTPYKNNKFEVCTIFCQTTFNLKKALKQKKKQRNQTTLTSFLKAFILTLF